MSKARSPQSYFEIALKLQELKISDKKSLFVLSEQNKNIYLSSRNLQGVDVVTATELNTYKIMKASTLILAESAVDVLQATFEN